MKPRRPKGNPVSVAVMKLNIDRGVGALLDSADLHSLFGMSKENLVYQYGWLLYVFVYASVRSGVPADDVDLRILRGTASALGDLAERPGDAVTDVDRAALLSGIDAARRLRPALDHLQVRDAVAHLSNQLARGEGLTVSDIEKALHPEEVSHG